MTIRLQSWPRLPSSMHGGGGYKCQLGLEEAITTLILRKHKDRISDNNASISRDLVSDAISKYNHRVANAGGKPDSILIYEDFGIHVVPALSCPCILPGESMNVIFAVPEADHDDAEITARINLTATKAKEDALSDFFTTHKVLFSASLARIPEDLLPSDSVKGPSWEARTFQRGAASSWARKGCLPPDIIEWATTPSAVQANAGRRLSQAAQAKEAPTSSESTSKDALPTEVEMTPEFKRLRSRRRRLFKEATATRRLRERRLTAYSIELTKSTEKVRELQAQVQQQQHVEEQEEEQQQVQTKVQEAEEALARAQAQRKELENTVAMEREMWQREKDMLRKEMQEQAAQVQKLYEKVSGHQSMLQSPTVRAALE